MNSSNSNPPILNRFQQIVADSVERTTTAKEDSNLPPMQFKLMDRSFDEVLTDFLLPPLALADGND